MVGRFDGSKSEGAVGNGSGLQREPATRAAGISVGLLWQLSFAALNTPLTVLYLLHSLLPPNSPRSELLFGLASGRHIEEYLAFDIELGLISFSTRPCRSSTTWGKFHFRRAMSGA